MARECKAFHVDFCAEGLSKSKSPQGFVSNLAAKDEPWHPILSPRLSQLGSQSIREASQLAIPSTLYQYMPTNSGWGRVEDWRGIPKVEPSRLLPVSSGSASIAKP